MKYFMHCLLCFFPLLTLAQQHEIDIRLENCLESNPSTSGQRNCMNEAEIAWDNELNKYYNLLMKEWPGSSKINLRTAQINWLKFRDAEFKLIHEYYFNLKEGSIFLVIGDNRRMEIVKERALEMKQYYDNYHD